MMTPIEEHSSTGRVVAVHADRGGTFTDLVRVIDEGGRLVLDVAKVPSDLAILGRLAGVAPLTMGTTVATNALLERRGVPTLLLVTAGFEDLPTLRDMRRPDLFDLDKDWPDSLSTQVIGLAIVEGRAELPALDLGPYESVVVALVDTCDDHLEERRIADLLRERDPRLYVVVARDVVADPGYLARIETALVDAAITPRLMASLVQDEVTPHTLAVRSDGTLGPAFSLRAHDAVLSGPAPGVLAVLAAARQAGLEHAVGLDMGGTSTDICLVSVTEGPRRREGELEVAGVRLSRAMLEVDTIAAGGGSILSCAGESLSVGPRSAGASPGPQCYGHGGPPTLTDAAVLAGLVGLDRFPIPLAPGRIDLPRPAGTEVAPEVLAQAYLDVARESMARAVERLAMARGVSLYPQDGATARVGLVAYGGAGAQHAAFVAQRLGIDTVVIHPAASVFCALGQLLAERAEHARWPLTPALVFVDTDHELVTRLVETAASLENELARRLDFGHATVLFELECGYVGSDLKVTVPWSVGEPLAMVSARFEAAFRARFGFVRTLRLEVTAVLLRAHERHMSELPAMSTRALGLEDGQVVSGPTCLFGEHTTIAVPAGWRAVSRGGLAILEKLERPRRAERVESVATPALGDETHDTHLARLYTTAIWQSRLMAVAEEGGAVLQRLAQSVSIKERLDFSCAVFSPDGGLVVNAPHIPVHLGAMGDTVRDIVAHLDRTTLQHGDAWLTNDPAAGGSHLPDLTVVTAVLHEGVPFFVASRAHHVDVGGVSPGSMPSRSTTLADEGFSLRRAPLVIAGRVVDLPRLVRESRQVDVVVSDLESQLAANTHMASRLVTLGPAIELVNRMALVTASAERFAKRFIAGTFAVGEVRTAREDLDGIELVLSLRRPTVEAHLIVDFTGTGGPHPGNLNAPVAVVRAAVLYALRVAIGVDGGGHAGEPPPLNEGLLRPLTLVLPSPSIVSPPPTAAVVGGNVETSQRLVDLFLWALGLRAMSAGTMNNLVIAGRYPDGTHWSSYETLGGGLGASPRSRGASARQVHMTNTRATDPEVLARRLPLIVRRFARRPGSGGAGLHEGGDGLIREIEVTSAATASLLAAWRKDGADGQAGGGRGAPGEAFVIRSGGLVEPWSGEPIELRPGDRVSVHTPGGGGFGPPGYLENRDT